MSDTRVVITKDTLSPGLAGMVRSLGDRRPVLEAMGTALAALARRSWRDASLRALRWDATSTGRPPLYKSGALVQSIRVAAVTNNSVTVGTDRPYAIFHQLGTKPYTIKPKAGKALFWPGAAHPVKSVNHPGLPARPFFPFDASGNMTLLAQRKIESAARTALATLLKP